MRPRSAPLVWFWILTPLALTALAWSSYQALAKERATNINRAFWMQRIEVGSMIAELEFAVASLLARESSFAPGEYQSYHQLPDSVPAALHAGHSGSDLDAEPAWAPSPFFAESRTGEAASYARLHFQLVPGQNELGLPAAPQGAERSLALERGHATPESIAAAEATATALAESVGLAAIAKLARETAQLPAPPLGGAGSFSAFFFESHLPGAQPGAELLALRLIDLADGTRALQGVWYDWPKLRAALLALAEAHITAGELSLAPATQLLRGGAAGPPRRSVATPEGGRLANLALDVHLGARPPTEPPLWTGTAQSLSAAWLVVLAALAAIHVSLGRAAQLSERRARFASAVTHELRTPLTTLCMYAEMLSAGLVAEHQLDDYYRTLKREADRLAGLIDNVLDHAGLESGREVEFEELDLATWLPTQLTAPSVTLELPSDEPLHVRADPSGLARILTNLIDNAAKYGAAPIALRVTRSPTHAELRLTDAGAGIDSPKHIFETFSRATSASSTTNDGSSTRGLGLGLALSRDLARAMNGELTLEHPGPGAVTESKPNARVVTPTTFLLRLPLSPAPSA